MQLGSARNQIPAKQSQTLNKIRSDALKNFFHELNELPNGRRL